MSMYEGNNNNGNNNNTNNGGYQAPKVNTSGFEFRNYDSTLQVSGFDQKFYNDSMSVEFFPELPANLQTDKKKLDYKNSLSTLVVPEKAMALYLAYKTKLLAAIEAGEEYSASVIIANVNALRISTGVEDTGEVRPYIQLIKGIDPDTTIAEVEIKYEFKPTHLIDNYNPTTGKFSGKTTRFAELDLVMENMKEFVLAIGNAQVHASRVVNRYFNDRISGNIEKIGEKVGANVQKKGGYGNNANYRNNTQHSPLFSTGSSTPNQAPDVPEESYSSLNDLEI